jgi:hypothetical protein
MQRLPPELFGRICIFMCTDDHGSHAIYPLRLVSRHFRDLVEPYRLRNLIVHGPDAWERLADALEGARSPGHAGIRHLYICDQLVETEPPGSFILSGWDPFKEAAKEAAQKLDAERLESLFARIIGTCAPHLRSLTLLVHNQHAAHLSQQLCQHPFPHLEHLSISCAESSLDQAPSIRMPQLRALDIDHRRPTTLTTRWLFIGATKAQCPTLKAVQIAGVDLWNETRFLSRVHTLDRPQGVHITVAPYTSLHHGRPDQLVAALVREGVEFQEEAVLPFVEWQSEWAQRVSTDLSLPV